MKPKSPLHEQAAQRGTTMRAVVAIVRAQKQCGHLLPATQLRQHWDYRATGVKLDDARKWLAEIQKYVYPHHTEPPRDVLAYRTHDVLVSMLREKQRRRARGMIPDTWCNAIEVRWAEVARDVGMGYRQEAEWNRPYKPGRHDWPSRRYDVLTVFLPTGKMPIVSADQREITLGPWTYRKGRGHTLSVIYHPQDADADRAAFATETNAERRAAIINACGETLTDLFEAEALQVDDFGKLYDLWRPGTPTGTLVFGGNYYGRFVRVVCPSTNRVYWLQVPDTCETAHAAVAATFGLTPTEYQPITQS